MEREILIIGGGPAGIVCASTAKKYYPDKKITLIKEKEKGVIPCGIPYMFHTLKHCEDNALGTAHFKTNGIKCLVDEAISLDATKKILTLKNNPSVSYSKLILATGSDPVTPPIEGSELKGVFPIVKEMSYLRKLKSALKRAKNIVIIGGGFIGVELADELSKYSGKKVSIVEFEKRLLSHSFEIYFFNP